MRRLALPLLGRVDVGVRGAIEEVIPSICSSRRGTLRHHSSTESPRGTVECQEADPARSTGDPVRKFSSARRESLVRGVAAQRFLPCVSQSIAH